MGNHEVLMLLQGSTALMAAAAWGHVDIVQLLLTNQSDAFTKNRKVGHLA